MSEKNFVHEKTVCVGDVWLSSGKTFRWHVTSIQNQNFSGNHFYAGAPIENRQTSQSNLSIQSLINGFKLIKRNGRTLCEKCNKC